MADFAQIVGAENIRASARGLTVAPASTEETAAVLRAASADSLALTPTGGGTKLTWGNAIEPNVYLDTTRLTGVREHSWGDLTATVAAGTSWHEMQQVLAPHNQRVALDPLFPARATVGGILATNDSGALRMKYGSLRDLLIGITIVLADGTIARSGGRVVKNVAGYDLPKLLTGSFGTLGVITEATFRLHPVPQHTASFTIHSGAITPLADLMHQLVTASMSLEAMQLRATPDSFAFDIQFASLPDVLTEHEQRLRTLASALTIEPALADTWLRREHLFADPASTVLKITALPTKLCAIIAGIALLSTQPGHSAQCVADPTGISTAALTASPDQLDSIIDDLRARLLASGGSVVILQRGALPHTADTWGPPPAAIDIMRAIKHEFDPHRLLNPGIFAGGI